MIKGLKPYPEYRDSGQKWLGAVPKHWFLKRIKASLYCVDERSRTGKEELLTVSSKHGVIPRNTVKVTMFKAESYVGYKLCWPGDLVINSLWAWAGGLGVSPLYGIVSTAYGVYRSRSRLDIVPRFFHELVRSSPFSWELHVRSKGIWISRLQLTDQSFLDAPIPLPPPEEQTAIVRFLDHANRKIDKFIRAKRKLIGLLNEQKQAIIHQAVTRGLDPNVPACAVDDAAGRPLKPSGVPWLGDIPAHWEVRRLKHLASFQSGDGITSLQIEPQGDYPVYGGNGLRGYSNRHTHEGHFVLIGRQGALCGNINYAKGKFFASEHAVVASLRGGYSVVWFGEMLKVMNLNQYSQSAAQPGLAVERIKNLSAPVPPIFEQLELVAAFQDQTAPLNTAIARTEREISLMQEYRTRLTADIVTGKLDVREAATGLPDLTGEAPAEPHPVDESLEPEEADPE